MSLLEKIDGMLEDNKKIHSYFDTIVGMLEEGGRKLDRLLASGSNDAINLLKIAKDVEKEMPIVEKLIVKGGTTVPKKGKYEWFKVKGLDKVKVRACSNEGCPYFLKFSEEKGKYEHWKYDPNTQEGGFVQDNCDYYFPEG